MQGQGNVLASESRNRTSVVCFLPPFRLLPENAASVTMSLTTVRGMKQSAISLGDVKPFAVMRNAEVNNLDDMTGYGLPKLVNAIPAVTIDICIIQTHITR